MHTENISPAIDYTDYPLSIEQWHSHTELTGDVAVIYAKRIFVECFQKQLNDTRVREYPRRENHTLSVDCDFDKDLTYSPYFADPAVAKALVGLFRERGYKKVRFSAELLRETVKRRTRDDYGITVPFVNNGEIALPKENITSTCDATVPEAIKHFHQTESEESVVSRRYYWRLCLSFKAPTTKR